MTMERWMELRRFFSELEFYAPPKTIAQFRLKDGYSFEGYLSTMGNAEDENGQDESAATIAISDGEKTWLDTFRISEFAWAKFGDTEWKDD